MIQSAVIVVALLSAAPADAQLISDDDRFMLFNECRPVRLGVELQGDFEEIGLTEDPVRTVAESRLRGARFYASEGDGGLLLLVNVTVVAVPGAIASYSVDVMLAKLVIDAVTGLPGMAPTWNRPFAGMGFPEVVAEEVVSVVTRLLDRFLTEYERVNDSGC